MTPDQLATILMAGAESLERRNGCATCGAEAGQECRTPNGRPRMEVCGGRCVDRVMSETLLAMARKAFKLDC